jgi:hypothetical protein
MLSCPHIRLLLLLLLLLLLKQLLLLLLKQLLLLYQTKNSGPACDLSSSPASRPNRSPSSAVYVLPTLLVW